MQPNITKLTNSNYHLTSYHSSSPERLLQRKNNMLDLKVVHKLKKRKIGSDSGAAHYAGEDNSTKRQCNHQEVSLQIKQPYEKQTHVGGLDEDNQGQQYQHSDPMILNIVSSKAKNISANGISNWHLKDKKKIVHEHSTTTSSSPPDPDQYVALDCEFVGVGRKRKSALARCSIVDYNGDVILDLYVKPNEHITDYRTPWSGIRPQDMKKAVPFKNARNMILKAIKNKIVVGHAVHNDFRALEYFHPAHSVRDTSNYKPLKKMAKCNRSHPASLKHLTRQLCGYQIQRGEHCSVEDSRATMSLFKLVHHEWENMLLAQKSEVGLGEVSHLRSISESSDDSYFNDNLWPTDL